MNITELETKSREELLELAKDMNLSAFTGLKKQELVMRLLQANAESQGFIFCGGTLEITAEGYGFLRQGSLLPSWGMYTFLNPKSAASACAPAMSSPARAGRRKTARNTTAW